MAKIDVYLRSIERFGAAGAVLTSGQSVTMKFPGGDRNATQVTPHDQLVVLIREVAPPAALELIDANRAARFEIDSNGTRYALSVQPKPGAWHVAIDPVVAAGQPPARTPRVATAPTEGGGELAIERGQYDDGSAASAPGIASGSALLEEITAAARGARATDVFLTTGEPPAMRIGTELQVLSDRGSIDAETIAREIGIVAPADARAAWTERGLATFAYSDGTGRVRATLTRDRRGPGVALRILVGEPPALARLGLPPEVAGWLDERGLVLIAGASGAGKTTTLAALVGELGIRGRRVIAFEDPIEILQPAPSVSQRALGEHAPAIGACVASAIREGADAIAIGAVTSDDVAAAVIDAVAAGLLVITTIAAGSAAAAAGQVLGLLPAGRRDHGKAVLERALLGTIGRVSAPGGRRFEVVAGRGRAAI